MIKDQSLYKYFCPVCNGRLSKKNINFWLFKCDTCGLLASDLEPQIPDKINASVINEVSRQIGLSAVREHNNVLILKKICNYFNGPATLLDVGSGLGFFLEAALAEGFDVCGIEPDANVVINLDKDIVRHGYFPDALEPNENFDLIVFNDVLEHIPDALSAVIAARDHLNQDGILVLNCPDRQGIFYRVASLINHLGISGPFNRLWQRDTPSPHRWYFKRDDLFQIGARCGFVPLATVDLVTLSSQGLYHRIFYMKGQGKFLSILTLIGVYILLPFIKFFPSDLGVALMRKKTDN